MTIGNNLFIWNIDQRQLEGNMKKAKEMFPKLEIIFVIINRKGDPAYGKTFDYLFHYLFTIFFSNF